jgi:hypothetical protein
MKYKAENGRVRPSTARFARARDEELLCVQRRISLILSAPLASLAALSKDVHGYCDTVLPLDIFSHPLKGGWVQRVRR